ncbi:endo alpha-1,4 polygalactosaminidase [Hylemonella gracilis str. Niagara R]|uniref:Endo alpha-1,4 polygalactosaminidase n=1 Tax=Hylemonella gracilis str. Niagara R TaxID=1458275 RepID=A0A016XFM6_9BURK|nr:endo alpha-1,4 polygalactosaminidase [Hylemonella gracilis str. Niagara R]
MTDTWQWQLKDTINTGYDVAVYDIDLFDTSTAQIAALQAAGKKVVCYFSAGSSEDWRDDFQDFEAADMGNPLDSVWVGEKWLDTRSSNVRNIMRKRLDLAQTKGCDGVEPDNVDGYDNDTGFPLTEATQLDYIRHLAAEAHARGLAIGLKNNVAQLNSLVDDVDFAVNEQCHEYEECEAYEIFITKGKPVFNAEYADRYVNNATDRQIMCEASRVLNIRTLVLPLELDDAFRQSCDP